MKLKNAVKQKPKDIAKAEQKVEKCREAFLLAAGVYDEQVRQSNLSLFDSFNASIPGTLQRFEGYKGEGFEQNLVVFRRLQEALSILPSELEEIAVELEGTVTGVDVQKSVETFIASSPFVSSLPEPLSFVPYLSASSDFPPFTPSEVQPFAFSEFLTSSQPASLPTGEEAGSFVTAKPEKRKLVSVLFIA